jgi:hypothetical protein
MNQKLLKKNGIFTDKKQNLKEAEFEPSSRGVWP